MNFHDVGERQIKTPARAVLVNRGDNAALLLGNVEAGQIISVNGRRLEVALENMPAGYKIATTQLEAGASIVSGGQVIGVALRVIRLGEIIHTHNLKAA